MKKILSVFLAFVMLMSILPWGVIGASAETAVVTETEAEDLLSNATCSVGQLQSEFTNGSETAWKLVPGTDWTYPTFDLGQKVDISKHDLIFDIYPANMKHFAMHVANLDGVWCNFPGVYYTPNQWTTVRVNMTANGKDVTKVTGWYHYVHLVSSLDLTILHQSAVCIYIVHDLWNQTSDVDRVCR